MFAKVIVDIAHAAVDRAFTYRIPEGLDVRPGHHVLLPFGQGDHVKEGFVLSVSEESDLDDGVTVKDVLACAEPYTVLLPEQIALAEWMQEAYHCLLVDALRLMIPALLRGSRIHEKRERIVYLADPAAGFVSKSHIQTEVVDLLKQTGQPMSVRDIKAFLPGAAPAIAALLKKRVLSESSYTVFRRPEYSSRTEAVPALTEEQAAALQRIEALSPGQTALLYGVTGSGKTEVYLRCIEACLDRGQGAIVLVPEIALTPQTVGRFAARFGDRIAVLHSRLSAGERFDEWRRIRLGKAPIVIGARSAVFAPVENLGLIVIDEEHETSYQSQDERGQAPAGQRHPLPAELLSGPQRQLRAHRAPAPGGRPTSANGDDRGHAGGVFERQQRHLLLPAPFQTGDVPKAGAPGHAVFEPAGVLHLRLLPGLRVRADLRQLRHLHDLP